MSVPPSPEAMAAWKDAQAEGFSTRITRYGMCAVVGPDGRDVFLAFDIDAAIKGVYCNEMFGGCVLAVRNVDGYKYHDLARKTHKASIEKITDQISK